jgi:hypothetical protein
MKAHSRSTDDPQSLGGKTACSGVTDMIYRDDECRLRTENVPANFMTLKDNAQNLIKKRQAKTRSA